MKVKYYTELFIVFICTKTIFRGCKEFGKVVAYDLKKFRLVFQISSKSYHLEV